MMMEKHEFVPTDLINWCGFGMKRDENGNMDVSEACCEREDHPIHAAQPKKPAGEPERVSDERLEEIISAGTNCFKICVPSEGEKLALELRTLRTQLADRDNHIKYAYAALGDANRSIYLFDHIRKLKEQLAEKDAAIEKARRDALEALKSALPYVKLKAAIGMNGPNDAAFVEAHVDSVISALAAQKKEG